MVSIGIKQFESKILEARGGIEPPIMVLQTIALPLGDRATGLKSCQFSVISYQSQKMLKLLFCTCKLLAMNSPFSFRMVFRCQFSVVSQKEKCVNASLQ